MTPEIAGTRLRYWLRGQWLEIELETDRERVGSDGWTIAARGPFGVGVSKGAAEFFPTETRGPALRILLEQSAPVGITIESWPSDPLKKRTWIEQVSDKDVELEHFIGDLPRGRDVQVRVGDQLLVDLKVDDSGSIAFTSTGHGTRRFEVLTR